MAANRDLNGAKSSFENDLARATRKSREADQAENDQLVMSEAEAKFLLDPQVKEALKGSKKGGK